MFNSYFFYSSNFKATTSTKTAQYLGIHKMKAFIEMVFNFDKIAIEIKGKLPNIPLCSAASRTKLNFNCMLHALNKM
jgi:hypothetical protein